MQTGPDQIIACPKCKGLAKHMTLISGNTFGVRVWTDGKQVAPMLPHPPDLVKCCHCAEFYWLVDAEEIGTVDRSKREGQQINPAWAEAREIEEPAEAEYYQALERGLATNAEQERNLRILAWWRGNDSFRDTPQEQSQGISRASGPWRANLEALAHLLEEEDDNDRIMKAEMFRELGEFETAKQLLDRVDAPDASVIVQQMRSLCDMKDTCVRELQFSAQ